MLIKIHDPRTTIKNYACDLLVIDSERLCPEGNSDLTRLCKRTGNQERQIAPNARTQFVAVELTISVRRKNTRWPGSPVTGVNFCTSARQSIRLIRNSTRSLPTFPSLFHTHDRICSLGLRFSLNRTHDLANIYLLGGMATQALPPNTARAPPAEFLYQLQ